MHVSATTKMCSVFLVAMLLTCTSRIQNPINKSKMRRRRLQSIDALQCDPNLLENRPKPALHPTIPNILQTSTYAASFPGSGYKLITKYLVESISGMLVGEAKMSPSAERMKVQKVRESQYIDRRPRRFSCCDDSRAPCRYSHPYVIIVIIVIIVTIEDGSNWICKRARRSGCIKDSFSSHFRSEIGSVR